jgi:hypothetical protein
MRPVLSHFNRTRLARLITVAVAPSANNRKVELAAVLCPAAWRSREHAGTVCGSVARSDPATRRHHTVRPMHRLAVIGWFPRVRLLNAAFLSTAGQPHAFTFHGSK